jgi:hypothetical protein
VTAVAANAAAADEPRSYYGQPVLNPPVWEARDVGGYLFLGGLAGASSVLAAGAQLTRRPALARTAKVGAVAGGALSVVALVHDLGRPARALNMLRVFKPTSPMSVGSWLLAGYVPAAATAAIADVSRRFPLVGGVATAVAALAGPAVATYTAPVVSDTAVPVWHEGRDELPFVFVASAAMAASGLGLVGVPLRERAPAARLAVASTVAAVAATQRMDQRLGDLAEPYRSGRGGRYLRAAKVLAVAGAVGTVVGRRSRLASALSGAALVTASACERLGVFHGGVASARDPAYTVSMQRRRLDERRAIEGRAQPQSVSASV